MDVRRPFTRKTVALLVGVGALALVAGPPARAAYHAVQQSRADAAAEREYLRSQAEKRPATDVLKTIHAPQGVHPCKQFPLALQEWGEICWEGTGRAVPTALGLRSELSRLGVTHLEADCIRDQDGQERCHLQGLLQGLPLGVSLAYRTPVAGLAARPPLEVHGGVRMFVRGQGTTVTQAPWTDVPLPPMTP